MLLVGRVVPAFFENVLLVAATAMFGEQGRSWDPQGGLPGAF